MFNNFKNIPNMEISEIIERYPDKVIDLVGLSSLADDINDYRMSQIIDKYVLIIFRYKNDVIRGYVFIDELKNLEMKMKVLEEVQKDKSLNSISSDVEL